MYIASLTILENILISQVDSLYIGYGMLKVHTRCGKTHEGKIFAIDPVTSSIILSGDAVGSYVLINPSQITNIEGDLNNIITPDIYSSFGIR